MKRTVTTLVLACLCLAAAPSLAQAAFGFESVEGSLLSPEGDPQLQAGAHPNLTVGFKLNSVPNPNEPAAVIPDGNVKDVEVNLPPGLIGNPTAVAKCSQSDLAVREAVANCDPQAQVGIATVIFEGSPNEVPLYNMEPPTGVAGQFAFNFVGDLVFVNASVTADGAYHLRASVDNISQGLPISGTSLTFWGVPAASVHDTERAEKGGFGAAGIPIPGEATERPFISNPTICTGAPLRTEIRTDSWQAPGAFDSRGYEADPDGVPTTIAGCENVPFEGQVKAAPTTSQADSPSGLDLDVSLAQNSLPQGISDSYLRDAVVTLPEGMAVNPSLAGGLATCSEGQVGLGSDAAPSCPEGAKIGSLSVTTPLLEEPLEGAVYLAQQRQNKFGSLLALYLVVNDPARGVLIKIPGKVEPDPSTGRLVARFAEAPQLPFSDLHVSLFGGRRAALITPPSCGTYETTAEFTPWSGGATVRGSDGFRLTSGPEGSPCPSGSFTPSFEAGVVDPAAAHFSPLELNFLRGDGSPRFSTLGVRLPKGLLASLAGIPYCSDAGLASVPNGEGTGAAQLASPSCPSASRVGSVAVAVGAGDPFVARTGAAYLAGPYKGAPLSLAFVVPAIAGPFDLGNVVVRVALQVNPDTTQVTAQSDPLPTILGGIPLDIRGISVDLDRGRFTVNPTSCAVQSFEATLASTSGAVSSPTRSFAPSSCGGLGFSPRLALALKGPTHRGAFPALTATLTAQPGQANISRAAVALPRSEFLAQNHIKTVCTRVQFAASACPEDSIYGYAEAATPLLGQPLSGPVYLRSSANKLPDLVAALRGQIAVDLVGRIDSKNKGLRATFEGVPDAPISSFTLRLRGGKKSLLVNSVDTCAKKLPAHAALQAQNGDRATLRTPLAFRCPKGKKAKKRGR